MNGRLLGVSVALLGTCLGAALVVAAPQSSPPQPPAGRPQPELTVDALSVVKLRSRAVAMALRCFDFVQAGTLVQDC